jgi:salicylate hydroxylase
MAGSARTVAVIGAGIGGLAAAIALRSVGYEVVVYEQAARFGVVGAGINLTPNAVRVLDVLGAGAALRGAASYPTFRVSRTWDSGAETSRLPMGQTALATYGSPQLTVHRADLLAALTALVPDDAIRLGRRLVAIHDDGAGVALEFAGGERARADAVICSDGIHSVVRTALFGDAAPAFTGMSAYRAVVPSDRVPEYETDAFVKWWGPEPKSQIVTMPLNGTADLFLFATVAGDVTELRERYRDFHAEARRAIDAVQTTHKTALYVREPLPGWTRGRIALLGDACHPMLPFMAQGAAMALEDAAVLARALEPCLPNAESIAHGLRRYDATRRPRAERIQRGSNENEWLRTGTNADWVYGYDATTAPLADA